MKNLFTLLLALGLTPALVQAQDPAAQTIPAPALKLDREQLATLLGPIALYPDPLVALILPASTFPSDIVLAARFVTSGDDPTLADEKEWDSSVKSLTRYPDTLKWLDENLEWTTQLGEAYLAQPEDVMDAIQTLRTQAQSVGNLVDTPEQRIVKDDTYVRIVPAQPEYIYVPRYDPEVVYIERPVARPLLSFSTGFLVGRWLNYDFDWHHRRLYCGDWHRDRGWDYRRHHDHDDHDRDRNRGNTSVRINNTNITNNSVYINNNITNYQVWQGDSRRRLASTRSAGFNRGGDRGRAPTVVRPRPFVEVANRETIRRPEIATTERSFRGPNDRRGPGNNNDNNGRGPNNGRGDDRDGRRDDRKGPFVMPRTAAPEVTGDGRPGGKGFPKGDPRKGDVTGGPNNRDRDRDRDGIPNRPDGRDWRPGDRPPGPGVADNDKRDNLDKLVRDPRKGDQPGNGNPLRPGTPAPGMRDSDGPGRPSLPGVADNDKRDNSDRLVRDPKKGDQAGNRPNLRPGTPAPGIRDATPNGRPPGSMNDGDRDRTPGPSRDDLTAKNRGDEPNAKGRPPGRPASNDSNPGNVVRTPRTDAPNQPGPVAGTPGGRSQADKDSLKSADPRKNAPSSRPPMPGPVVRKEAPDQRDGPKPPAAVADRRDSPKPAPSVAPRREMPKPQVAAPQRREAPKPQAAPPAKREMPKAKVAAAPERREAPRPQMKAPQHREAPKVKARVAAAPVHREAPKPQASKPRSAPKPKASAPAQRSAPKVQAAKPKPQAAKPAPKAKPSASKEDPRKKDKKR